MAEEITNTHPTNVSPPGTANAATRDDMRNSQKSKVSRAISGQNKAKDLQNIELK